MKMYFVLHSGEDGPSFEQLDEATLIKRLNEHYWGNTDQVWTPEQLTKTPRLDLSERSCMIIIHGEVIVPKPEKIVETWRVR